MKTLVLIVGGLVSALIGFDDAETVKPQAETVEQATQIFVPLPTSVTSTFAPSESPTVYIDPALQERINALEETATVQAQINDATITRIQTLEGQLAALNATTPQLGRVEAMETIITELTARVEAVEARPIPAVPLVADNEVADWASADNPYQLLLFTTTDCAPCQQAKATLVPWLKAKGWPVEVFAPYADEELTYNVDTFPTWIALRNGQEVNRWVGANSAIAYAEIREAYGITDEVAALSELPVDNVITFESSNDTLANWIDSHSDSSDYSYPGSIYNHLLDHGWSASQLAGLTHNEMVELHDATHEGRINPSSGVAGASNYSSNRNCTNYSSGYSYSSYSNCPGGNCGRPRAEARAFRRANRRANNGWFIW